MIANMWQQGVWFFEPVLDEVLTPDLEKEFEQRIRKMYDFGWNYTFVSVHAHSDKPPYEMRPRYMVYINIKKQQIPLEENK